MISCIGEQFVVCRAVLTAPVSCLLHIVADHTRLEFIMWHKVSKRQKGGLSTLVRPNVEGHGLLKIARGAGGNHFNTYSTGEYSVRVSYRMVAYVYSTLNSKFLSGQVSRVTGIRFLSPSLSNDTHSQWLQYNSVHPLELQLCCTVVQVRVLYCI